MKSKKEIFEKLSSGKLFYLISAVSVLVVLIAVAAIYNASLGGLKDIVTPQTTIGVDKNQTGVSDPRTETTTAPDFTTEKETTTEKEKITEKHTNEPSRVITTAKPTEPTIENSLSFILPSEGGVLKEFSVSPVYDKTMADWRSHGGTDYLAEEGSEVKAVGNGIVTRVMSDPSWGYIIELDCGEFVARYCGLKGEGSVALNSSVKQGEIIGKVGTVPCEISDESHLHFEVIVDGDRVDPKKIMLQ